MLRTPEFDENWGLRDYTESGEWQFTALNVLREQ